MNREKERERKRGRERERVEDGRVYTQGRETCSLFFSRFERLVQGYLKASYHLSFSSLLYFHESGIGPSHGIVSS